MQSRTLYLATTGFPLGTVRPSCELISISSLLIISQSKHWTNTPTPAMTMRMSKCSPGHFLLQAPNGIYLIPSSSFSLANLSGLKFMASSHNSGSFEGPKR
ncbi:hypothetical protein IHE45_19G019600 [Dioscorea alata]|uniref:Uncharacterized protein n=1 Tax=Dioscorea alata TaxID=55571 RepID=A0ACB7TWP3_DIOAL|nr:hypothetical protein IHE45_19G019600 [Dioscorea alata]